MNFAVRVWLFCVLGMIGVAGSAAAHDARPLSINIIEQRANLYTAQIRVPPSLPVEDRVAVLWPAGCIVVSDDARELENYGRETVSIRCKESLEGKKIGVSYRVYNPALPTLFRLNEIAGKVFTQVLAPNLAVWSVPESRGQWQVASGYFTLGVRHILTGIDHLFFVTGLLILAGTTRRLLVAITGFTIAHSITLSLSALNLVVLPEPPVEAAIALSILYLAYQITHRPASGLAGRYPLLVASSFGLLHGFGFAAALRDAGLPAKELALGLLCFNSGVEIGQISFIVGILAMLYLVRATLGRTGLANPTSVVPRHMRIMGGYGLGIPAAFWFFERLAAF